MRSPPTKIVLLPGQHVRCGARGCTNTASTFAVCRSCREVVARCACESASRAAGACCAMPWDDG